MIVAPDFLDHWRTRMVVDALGGDELAPTYILRLWGHCQARKSDSHKMPPAGLKAQCRCPHEAAAFEQALTDAGFVQRDGDTINVLGWAEQNASLLAAWENGSKGGRPSSKKPKQNPRVTQGEPMANPAETHGEPIANPGETEKIRVDEISPSDEGDGEKQHATRLPKPFALPVDWRADCKALRPDLDPDSLADKFADYWHGVPGPKGKKLDWRATFRNFVRTERGPPRNGQSPPQGRYAAASRTLFGSSRPESEVIDVEAR